MIEFKKITIDHKPIFDRHLIKAQAINSEASFATLFTWAKTYNTTFFDNGDFLLIRAFYDNQHYSTFPMGVGDFAPTLTLLMDDFSARGLPAIFKPLTADSVKILEQLYPGRFSYQPMRFAFDYVYRTRDLIDLAGRKYHSKRNHLNNFLMNYANSYSLEEINQFNKGQCLDVVTQWIVARKQDYSDELASVKRLFSYYEQLNLKGLALKIDGHFVAVTIGENHGSNTALIHLEKADADVRGSYAAINQMFLANCFSYSDYVNREEDLGIEGLRKAKLSYHPAFLIEKFVAIEN